MSSFSYDGHSSLSALYWTNMDHTEICTTTLSADLTIKIYQNMYTSFDDDMCSQTKKIYFLSVHFKFFVQRIQRN
jgi:hypothetical protein